MTTSKSEQLEICLAHLRRIPAKPQGPHLTDEEMAWYSMDAVSVEELQRLDAHLASCESCAGSLEEVLDATSPAGEWRGQIAALWSDVKHVFASPAAPATLLPECAGDVIFEGQTDDGTLEWQGLRTEDKRRLRIAFSSSSDVWLGTRITLKRGDFARLITLTDQGAGAAGGDVVIDADEWAKASSGPLVYQIVRADGETIAGGEIDV